MEFLANPKKLFQLSDIRNVKPCVDSKLWHVVVVNGSYRGKCKVMACSGGERKLSWEI